MPEGQDVYVLVHPLATDQCWVQPAPVLEDGEWHSVVYLGSEEAIGEHFEVWAIIGADLSEGDQIPVADFPECSAKFVVRVTTVVSDTATPTEGPAPISPTETPAPVSPPEDGGNTT
jgi:hypothetical protein